MEVRALGTDFFDRSHPFKVKHYFGIDEVLVRGAMSSLVQYRRTNNFSSRPNLFVYYIVISFNPAAVALGRNCFYKG